MKKYLLSGVVIVAFVLYVMRSHAGEISTTPPPVQTPNPTPAPMPTVQYKDGVYTGKVADAFYGFLQVRAIISGGKLTNVEFLQYPNDVPTSRKINEISNPLLKAEAIQAQSAQVDIISGATQSAEAFQKSLASALAQAKK